MTHQDAEKIIAIAAVAAMADGSQDATKLASIADAATRLGLSSADVAVQQAVAGTASLEALAAGLSGTDARHAAYEVALAVCNAGGEANAAEESFLQTLAVTLGIDVAAANEAAAHALASTSRVSLPVTARLPMSPPVADWSNAGAGPISAEPTSGSASAPPAPGAAAPDTLDTYILDQAMLTAALELLPDRLANLGILPLQMRLVHHIGQQYGQQTDAGQIKDLAATFGLGAAAQVMESVVRKAFSGIAGGLLGGLFGGAAGVAAGGAVTFASTYALGHAAQQYYAQGRTLSTADMKALFNRFQNDATTMYPRVQDRIAVLAQGSNLASLMRSVTG